MREVLVLYAFVGIMALNLLTSFVYLVGFTQIKAYVRRAYRAARASRALRVYRIFGQKAR